MTMLHECSLTSSTSIHPSSSLKHQLIHNPPAECRPSPSPSARRRVSRCLFGRPDPNEQREWLTNRLNDCIQESSERWGFDFQSEIPVSFPGELPSTSTEWEWTPISSNSLPSPYQPVIYVSPDLASGSMAVGAGLKLCKSPGSALNSSSTSSSSVNSSLNSSTNSSLPSPRITGYFSSRKRSHAPSSCDQSKSRAVGDTPNRRRLATASSSAPKIARQNLSKCLNGGDS